MRSAFSSSSKNLIQVILIEILQFFIDDHLQDMPLEELLKLYNYGGANSGPPEPSAPSDSGASKRGGAAPSQERLRDVRPDKMRQDKNGVVGSKTKNPEVISFLIEDSQSTSKMWTEKF